MKYKVGDRVRIRKDLIPYNAYGGILFGGRMMLMKGKVVTIANIDHNAYSIEEDGYRCYWSDAMIQGLANSKKIVITTDGKETLARLYEGKKVVKSAITKCSPDDEFDFMEGAKIAFERLQKTNESKYFTGKIVCTEGNYGCFTKGKIYEVVNGKLCYDDGVGDSIQLKDLEDINRRLSSEFIELVEE